MIGFLLYLANKKGISSDRKIKFYPLKNKLLPKYGVFDGWDLQRLDKECWACNGAGCYRCRDTGIYETKRIMLDRYKIGNFLFHQPKQVIWDLKYYHGRYGEPVSVFDGLIRHKTRLPWLCIEAELWLYLLFDRKAFFYYLDHGIRAKYPRPLPLLFIRDCFNLLYQWKENYNRALEIRKIKFLDLRKDVFPDDADLPF